MDFSRVSLLDNLPATDLLVVFTGDELSAVDHDRLATELRSFASAVAEERSEEALLTSIDGLPAERVLLHSLELVEDDNEGERLRKLANAVVETVREQGFSSIAVLLGGDRSEEALSKLSEGLILAGYGYSEFTDKNKDLRDALDVYFVGVSQEELDATEPVRSRAGAANRARDINNRPANELYPQSFVDYALDLIDGTGLEATVYDHEQLEADGRVGLIAVGQGSAKPPRMLHLQWGDDPDVALLGKGVTFDTGGISIKSSAGMWDMRSDMSGAGAVLHAAFELARRETPVSFHAVCVLAENMPGDSATRPGDVITYRNDLSVEIRNTDAEGRLILADGLIYLQEQGADTILESSTLTGSVIGALGHRYAGVCTRDEDLWDRLSTAAEATGDLVWRLPMPGEYEPKLKSSHADVSNIPSDRNASATTAGLFLNNFVEDDTRFIHTDIASTALHDDSRSVYTTPGCTGFGTRLFAEFVESFSE